MSIFLPPIPKGKPCELPGCEIIFFRNVNESTSNFRKRKTCCIEHARALKGALARQAKEENNEDYRLIDPNMISCVNCYYVKEDDEVGEHCKPCTIGQNFKAKNNGKHF